MPLLTDEERRDRKQIRFVAMSMFYTLAVAFVSSAALGVCALARLVF